MTKLLSVGVGILAAVITPIALIASGNSDNLDKRFEELDTQETEMFTSVEECTEKGFGQNTCQQSFEEAVRIANQLGTTVAYDTRSECETNHNICDEDTYMVPIVTSTGQTTITTMVPVTKYEPPMVAWQAAVNDPVLSVPLYAGPEEDVAVRKDGARFDIQAPRAIAPAS